MINKKLSLEDFHIEKDFIGNPSNKIYLVRDKSSDDLYIYKKIRISNLQKQIREVQAQKILKHKFVIRLLKYRVGEEQLEMLIEYASRGDLFDYINSLECIMEFTLLEMFYKIVIAIDFIHSNGFIHRDIKPENILIGDDMEPKMADFGSSVSKEVIRNTFCGTYEYMAPEIYMREKQPDKIDIWSLGILLFEMSHNVTPFQGKNIYQIKDMIENRELPFHPQISLRIRQIVWKILRINPRQRPSAREILMFPEFNVISGKFKHLIPKNNIRDRLNFDMLKGRILTLENHIDGRESEEREHANHKFNEFDEKKMLKKELQDFKENWRLPQNVSWDSESHQAKANASTSEYDYARQEGALALAPGDGINLYRFAEHQEQGEKTAKAKAKGPNAGGKAKNLKKRKLKTNLTKLKKDLKKSQFPNNSGSFHEILKQKKVKSKRLINFQNKRTTKRKYKKKVKLQKSNLSYSNKFDLGFELKTQQKKVKRAKNLVEKNYKTFATFQNALKLKDKTSLAQKKDKLKKIVTNDKFNEMTKSARIESFNTMRESNNKTEKVPYSKIVSLHDMNSQGVKKYIKRMVLTKNDFLKKKANNKINSKATRSHLKKLKSKNFKNKFQYFKQNKGNQPEKRINGSKKAQNALKSIKKISNSFNFKEKFKKKFFNSMSKINKNKRRLYSNEKIINSDRNNEYFDNGRNSINEYNFLMSGCKQISSNREICDIKNKDKMQVQGSDRVNARNDKKMSKDFMNSIRKDIKIKKLKKIISN